MSESELIGKGLDLAVDNIGKFVQRNEDKQGSHEAAVSLGFLQGIILSLQKEIADVKKSRTQTTL